MNKLRVMSLFSGIGAFEKALTNLNVEYELVNFCEVDKYAAESYCAVHGEDISKNLGDITTVDIESLSTDIDLLTHGSPCTSFSIAGLQKGGDEGSGTRSSLMWNSVEIIKHTKPKYVVWENVPNVLSNAHKHNFDKYLDTLMYIGYTSYHKVLNASDFGIPQNRKRIYVVSIRDDIKQSFMFPNPKINSKLLLRDLLEPNNEVDLKYFIIADKVKKLIDKKGTKAPNKEYQVTYPLTSREHRTTGWKDVSPTLCARDHFEGKMVAIPSKPYQAAHPLGSREQATNGWTENVPTLCARDYKDCKVIALPTEDSESSYTIQKVGNIVDTGNWEEPERGNIYSPDGIAPTLNTCGGGNLQPKILFSNDTTVQPCLTPDREEKRQNGPRFKENDEDMFTLTTQDRHGIMIKQATKAGSIFCEDGGVFNGSYPDSKIRRARVIEDGNVTPTLQCDGNSLYKIQKLGNIIDNSTWEEPERGNIYSPDGISPTLKTCSGGDLQPKMLFNNNIPNIEEFQYEGYYIRKLTPKEYWRLMDFTDVDFYKAKNRLNEKFYKGKDKSTSQLYKQAGNSIVVKVLEGIFTNLIVNKQPKLKRNSLFR